MEYIVVLNGESDAEDRKRLAKAYEIYKSKIYSIIVSDRFEKSLLEEILNGEPYIDVKKTPLDTMDNAFYAKDILRDLREEDKLSIVTSNYHAKRAKKTFEKIFNTKVSVYIVDVNTDERTNIFEAIKNIYYSLILIINPKEEGYHRLRDLEKTIKIKIKKLF